MRIFVTGATGFLGSRLVPLLQDHELLCLSRDPQKRAPIRQGGMLVGDLAQPESWRAQIERFAPQWCVHLAWEGLPDYSLSRCRANLDASLNLIEAVVNAGATRIVVAGSCWEYGDASGAVQEDAEGQDCGTFAATKHALRTALHSFAHDRGIEYRWGRIFFAYGPSQRPGSLIPQCRAAYSAGRQPEIRHPELMHDFVYVDDVARGMLAITEADIASGVFNLGSGTPTTVGQVVNRVASYYGVPPPFGSTGSEAGFWADTTKTTAATGWRATTSLDDGIPQTLQACDGGR